MATIDRGALAHMFTDIEEKIEETIHRIGGETRYRSLDDAAQVLRAALAHHGVNTPDDWCRNTLDTLRRASHWSSTSVSRNDGTLMLSGAPIPP